jgi:hypothetical protein
MKTLTLASLCTPDTRETMNPTMLANTIGITDLRKTRTREKPASPPAKRQTHKGETVKTKAIRMVEGI